MADEPRPPRQTAQLSLGKELLGLAKGLGATFSEALKPSMTVEYPEDKTPRSERGVLSSGYSTVMLGFSASEKVAPRPLARPSSSLPRLSCAVCRGGLGASAMPVS